MILKGRDKRLARKLVNSTSGESCQVGLCCDIHLPITSTSATYEDGKWKLPAGYFNTTRLPKKKLSGKCLLQAVREL